jgi:hypothetical protein
MKSDKVKCEKKAVKRCLILVVIQLNFVLFPRHEVAAQIPVLESQSQASS